MLPLPMLCPLPLYGIRATLFWPVIMVLCSLSLRLNRIYSALPDSIKFILDNLQVAYTRNHHKLFQKTLQALEIHLVNLTAQTEVHTSHYTNLVSKNANLASDNEAFKPYDPYTSQLFSKEEIHSMDKLTIMGTGYARLSLKTQSLLRSAIANLPTDIQFHILRSKAMSRSFDLLFQLF